MFLQGPQLGVRLTLLVFLSISLMVFDKMSAHTNYVRSSLLLLISPVQYIVDMPFALGEYLKTLMQTHHALIQENHSLKNEQLFLRAQIQRLAALEQENARLKVLLKSSASVGDRVLVAKLLRLDPDPFSHRLILDKGAHEGVFLGQPLLDAYGVMGQIVEVGEFTSTALLISDSSHALPVQNNRNGVRAIAVGTGHLHRLNLMHVTNTVDFQEGDLLVTSGLGQRFPEGYPVGVITQITPDPGALFLQIKLKPLAQLDKSREVLLVWPTIESYDQEARHEKTSKVNDQTG